MRWIVTREKSDCADLLRALPNAVCVPAISRVDLPWPVWPSVHSGRTLIYMVTSAHVAQRLPADGIAVAALEPKTSEMFGDRLVLKARGGAIALARALAATPYHVRYPTSDLADAEPLRALLPGRIDVAVVYETRAPAALANDLRAALVPEFGLYFASPSAVTHVFAVAVPRPTRVITLGATTRDRYASLAGSEFPAAELVHDQASLLSMAL